MGFGRDTRTKILTVSHFQSRIGSDHDYRDPGYGQAHVDVTGDEYVVMDVPQGESGLKLRGLTEKKRRRGSVTTAAPRPQPSYQYNSSSSAGQNSYYQPASQSAYAPASAAYFQGPMQSSPPLANNSTFIPSSQQYQTCNPNQGYGYLNANQPNQSQGQQQQQPQQPQYHNQGYNQNNDQYTSYVSCPN